MPAPPRPAAGLHRATGRGTGCSVLPALVRGRGWRGILKAPISGIMCSWFPRFSSDRWNVCRMHAYGGARRRCCMPRQLFFKPELEMPLAYVRLESHVQALIMNVNI